MIQHVKRLRFVAGLAAAALLACSPASASPQQTDAGTAASDGGTAAKDTSAQAPDEGSAKEGGGRCTGKATFCAVYSQTFCSSQPGCSYSFSTSTCTGLAPKCETATNQAFCKKIKGCSWK